MVAFISILAPNESRGAAIVVDTFDQGAFAVTFPPDPNSSDLDIALPFGTQRRVSFNFLPTIVGTVRSRTLDTTAGTLTFSVNGSSQSADFPLSLQLVYGGGGPYDISDESYFILGFSQLSGVGSLYVEVGSSSEPEGLLRLDLTAAGDLWYPVSGVRENSIHTVNSFNVLRFIFEARSPEFSFTLDEIRLVPEPSAALLGLAAGAGLLTRRRRIT